MHTCAQLTQGIYVHRVGDITYQACNSSAKVKTPSVTGKHAHSHLQQYTGKNQNTNKNNNNTVRRKEEKIKEKKTYRAEKHSNLSCGDIY